MSTRSARSLAQVAALMWGMFVAGGCSVAASIDGGIDAARMDAARMDAATDGNHDSGMSLDASGGPKDAGPDVGSLAVDAGCSPSSCDIGELCVDGACRCGVGSECGFPVTYCHDGTCIDRPTLVVEAAEERCADLGVPYTSPAFLRRVTVRGRPGASGALETIRRGCPPITLTSPIVLDGAGIFTETEAPATPATDCADERIGLYQYRATVDGVATDIGAAIIYNSLCPTAATCGLAEVLRACAP